MSNFADSPLQPVVGGWMNKIHQAMEHKRQRFGRDAEEAMQFLTGPYDWLYGDGTKDRHFRLPMPEDGETPLPGFQMTFNKSAELVALFGPSLYHRNPVRQVNPRKFPVIPPEVFGPGVGVDPAATQMYQQYMAQQNQLTAVDSVRAQLLSTYLNYTPTALDLKTESRWAIDEAIIKGMGCLWPETYQPAGAPYKLAGSFYDSVDNLQIDPDMESLREAKWVARRCVHPVWEVERMYNLPPGTLRGGLESYSQTADVDANPDGDYRRKRGETNDLLVYWKVYSKMGLGGRMKGVAEHMRAPLEQFGDFCFLAITDGLPYPLNLPPALTDTPGNEQAIMAAVRWPTPFWADDAWPFVPVYFNSVPRSPWPMSILSPAMGELKFLNWAYSFIAGKIATTCRDFIAMLKSAGEEMKQRVLSGRDLTLLEIETEHKTISEVVQFLQHPPFNGDIWKVIEAVTESFERRTGLTELMYGQTGRQLRSAEEANLKKEQTNIRPDDMANKVEDAMSSVARAEALAARWHLSPQDVQPVLGPVGAQFWEQYVYSANPAEIIHSLEYRIEANSARKPNKDRDAANMRDVMQNVFTPLLQACMAVGDFTPVNRLIEKWGETLDMDLAGLGIQFPNVPPPQSAPQGPPPKPAA